MPGILTGKSMNINALSSNWTTACSMIKKTTEHWCSSHMIKLRDRCRHGFILCLRRAHSTVWLRKETQSRLLL